jgi:hypothetical protein
VANPAIRSSYELRIQAALAGARHAAAINHPGLQGEVREILVRELLRPLLPPTFALGTGKIVDHLGNESDQIDVVIYDRAVMPPLLFSQTAVLGLFPVEACVYAIEVKSTATAATWAQASRNATSLLRLARLIPPGGQIYPPVLPMFFAFDSNLKSPASQRGELKRWNRFNNVVSAQAPATGVIKASTFAAVCVAGQGYGYWRDEPQNDRKWRTAVGDNGEILEWFMGVSNTLFLAVGRAPAQYGNYLG